jgi:hypothetical protein
MKRAFILTAACGLQSALVPVGTEDVLSIGDRIITTRALDLGVAQINAGEGGTIDFIDLASGLVEILMDVVHWGLAAWENHMWLEPYGTEDIIDGIELSVSISAVQKAA